MGIFYVNNSCESIPIEEFENRKDELEKIQNKIVRTGAAYMEDKIFKNDSASWYDKFVLYMHVGTCDHTNDGLLGPSSAPKLVSGDWNGASPDDYKLTSGVASSPLTFLREGHVVTVKAVFTDAQLFPGAETEIAIREVGLFLSDTEATSNPLNASSQMDKAMLCRGVRVSETLVSGVQYYYDDPDVWEKDSGRNKEIFYKFTMS